MTGSCAGRPDPEPNVPSASDILIKPVRRAAQPSCYLAIGGMSGRGRQSALCPGFWTLVSPEPRCAVPATCRIAKGTPSLKFAVCRRVHERGPRPSAQMLRRSQARRLDAPARQPRPWAGFPLQARQVPADIPGSPAARSGPRHRRMQPSQPNGPRAFQRRLRDSLPASRRNPLICKQRQETILLFVLLPSLLSSTIRGQDA